MKEFIFNKKDYSTYKEFYEKLYQDMDGKNMIDWEDCPTLNYSADDLSEFLWYCHNDNIYFIFKNFDFDKINNYKNYENYKWFLIFKVFKRFVEKYPNNKLEFINED